jgi:hypothetical protein
MAMRAIVTTKNATYEGPLVRDEDDETVVVLDDETTGNRVTVRKRDIVPHGMRVASDR